MTGKQRVLIATTIVDEGLDIDKINVLILAGAKKSDRQYLQRVGRALRRKRGENVVIIYDFYDTGHRLLDKHTKKRHNLYLKEEFDVTIV